MLGIPAEEILRISAKTGEGVPELLDAIVARIPPPTGDADAPLQALIFDSFYDPYRGVVSSVRVFNGTLSTGARLRFLQAKANARRRGDRRAAPGADAGRRARPRRGRLPHRRASRTSARRASARPSPPRRDPAEALAGLPRPEADGVLRPLPGRRRRVRRPARGAREAAAQRLVVHLRARDVGRARLRVPLRLPRPAAHGDRARAPRARVRPRRSSPPRRTSSTASSTIDGAVEIVDNPSAMPPPNDDRSIEEPYVNITILTPTEYVGHAHGAVPGAAGRDEEDGVPLGGARRARLRDPARPRSSWTSSTS